jgi:predicted ATPase/class 3 adenylate cyclase
VPDVQLPAGSVTFLFTDVEGSTQLFRRLGPRYPDLLGWYHELIKTAVTEHFGVFLSTQGDGCFAAFQRASDGIAAALTSQARLEERPLDQDREEFKVRMGLHTGSAVPVDGDYTALAVHRAARVSAAAHGGQVICTGVTIEAARSESSAERALSVRDLGPYVLKDFPDPEHIYQVDPIGNVGAFPPLRARSPSLHNLPIARTAFVGRERDKNEVKKLLDSDVLVTVVGSGGAGKTRLCTEVAGELASGLADGAWLVELAGLTDPALVASAVAQGLAVRVDSDLQPLDVLSDSLASKEILVVLDNCEHLLDACAELADRLLRSCPRVKILASSRERIGIPAEVVWRIPSMGVPEIGVVSSSDLAAYDAVRLFVERAMHSFPDFSLDDESAASVGEICRRLDGIPLAIELAAARVGSLRPQEIAQLLDDRFQLLSEGNRAALARHRTLRAALDWSIDLLGAPERELFARLGVFAGSWTMDAAVAICGQSGAGGSVTYLLGRLDECSLIQRATEGSGSRYDMLESVRELARAHLNEMDEGGSLRQAHLDWFTKVSEEADLESSAQRRSVDALRSDHENLRAALGFALESPGNAGSALKIASNLAPFWKIHGDANEGIGWLERALNETGPDSPDRPAALLGAGGLALVQGDYRAARSMLEQSAALFRAKGDQAGAARTGLDLAWVAWHEGDVNETSDLLEGFLATFDDAGDSKGLAQAHRMLGVIAAERHDLDVATSHLEQALSSFQRTGDLLGASSALTSLGITAEYRGDLLKACELMEDSLAIARECGDSRRVAGALDNLGFFWQQRGDLDRARDLHVESLEIFRSIGDRSFVAAALTNLGSTARQRGEFEEARTLLTESLSIARDTADRSRDVADVLEEIAALEVAEGYFDRGLMLFAAAETIREAVGYPLREFFRSMYEPLIDSARSQLPDHGEAWATGRRISVDDAIRLALRSP